MTTITTDDIRAELESMNAAEEKTFFDFAGMAFNAPIKPVYIVVGEVRADYPEDRHSGIFGLYDSKDDAEKVASLLEEYADAKRVQYAQMSYRQVDQLDEYEWRNYVLFDYETWDFTVKKLYMNDSPANECGNGVEMQVEF